MKIASQKLRQAFEVVNAVEDSAAADSSHFIRLQQDNKQLTLTLTGTLWAEATAEGDGTGKWVSYVDRRILKAFLATADGKEVDLIYKDKKLSLKANSRIDLSHHNPISGYETWKPASTYDITDELQAAFRTGVEYLPSGAGTESVAAINCQKGYGVLVTDTLFLFAVLGIKVPVDALIPSAVASSGQLHAPGKLAVDKDGVGIALDNGFLYEPPPDKLAKYPINDCRNHIDAAVKASPVATVTAKDACSVFRDAQAFLLDKAEAGTLSSLDKGGLQLTLSLNTGTFRRTIPATLNDKLPEVKISVKKFVPWLDFVSRVKDDAVIEISRVTTRQALTMRFSDGKRQYVLIAADL